MAATDERARNRQFLLAARPQGMVKESDFDRVEGPVPQIGNDEFLIRTRYISVDPSMRGQMENRADYVAPLQIGDVMRAGGVGEVVASNHADYPIGSLVSGTFGTQQGFPRPSARCRRGSTKVGSNRAPRW